MFTSNIICRYKNVEKTDVRQSWIKHPKSAPKKAVSTMEELFPAPEKYRNYRLLYFNNIYVN